MLTKALGETKVDELCAEIGQTEPHAKTLDKKPKKLKKIKFPDETMEANDGAVKNKLMDSRTATIKDEPMNAKLRWMHSMY